MMDMDHEADELLARIRAVRLELDGGRLSVEETWRYRQLGRQVERITRRMDAAFDVETAQAFWRQGARLIRSFLDEHFPVLTVH